jgi:hypothetical protein
MAAVGTDPKKIEQTIKEFEAASEALEVKIAKLKVELAETEDLLDRHYTTVDALAAMLDPTALFKGREPSPHTNPRLALVKRTRAAVKHLLRKQGVPMRRVDIWNALQERHASFNRHVVETVLTTMHTHRELVRVKRGYYAINEAREDGTRRATLFEEGADAPPEEPNVWDKADNVMLGSFGKVWDVTTIRAALIEKQGVGEEEVTRERVRNYFVRRVQTGQVQRVAHGKFKWIPKNERKKKKKK